MSRAGGLVAVGMAMFLIAASLAGGAGAKDDERPMRVIVLFKEKVDRGLIEDTGGEVVDTLTIVPAAVTSIGKDGVRALKKSDKISSVEEDFEASICGEGKDEASGKGKPQPSPQPTESTPWGVKKINADQAWGTSKGSGVIIAVLDTGVDQDHPDLKDNIKGGVNIINPKKSYEDDNGHGTHCAGVIAALDNDIGVVGVAPQAHIYAVKVLNNKGRGFYSDIIKGIQWAVNNGAQVISMSLGGTSDSQALEDACDAARVAGIVLVAAAGNDGSETPLYPAAYDSVIAVSATDNSDKIAEFSSFGDHIDLAAPGVNIPSTYKGDTYKTLSGTSMACPHVSGTAALVLGDNAMSPEQLQSRLESTAIDLGVTGRDKYFGSGLVDAAAAVGVT